MTHYPHIVVHPPALDGSRRVTEGDVMLGIASHLDDVVEILRLPTWTGSRWRRAT